MASLQIRPKKESGAVKLLARYKPETKADCGEGGSETKEEGKESLPDKNQHLHLRKECSPSAFSVNASNGQERVNGHKTGPHSTDGNSTSQCH